MPKLSQRLRVWRGEIRRTTGGLTKVDLMKNSKGKIVSKRKSMAAYKVNNLGSWLREKGDRFKDKRKGLKKEDAVDLTEEPKKKQKTETIPDEKPKKKKKPAAPKPKPVPAPVKKKRLAPKGTNVKLKQAAQVAVKAAKKLARSETKKPDIKPKMKDVIDLSADVEDAEPDWF